MTTIDGSSLTLEALVAVARDPTATVALSSEAEARIKRASRLVADIAERYREHHARWKAGESEELPVSEYGVTTGFGEFKDIRISPDELEALQRNLLLSHATGFGANTNPLDSANYFPPEVVRAVLLLRLNTFAKGHSGLRPEMVERLLAMLHRGIVPLVPIHGSVGSSGDLCPLAHLFVVLVGVGRYVVVRSAEEMVWGGKTLEVRDPTRDLELDLGLPPLAPSFKESLALINGATFSAALLALAVFDAERTAQAADVAAALSLEAACGCARAFDPKVHAARGQRGQEQSAANLRALLSGSRLLDSAGAVQDPYSLRGAPAVHGASRDALAYVWQVAEREINAATDNPLFFPGDDGQAHSAPPWDFEFRDNWPEGYPGAERASYSAINFHGQPVALAADFAAIALAELGSISERRTQLLLDKNQNRNLPPNLAADAGVQSGLMIPQYGAAGLVSENKVLAHPASVDSIPTAANAEDHNSMATIAARKLRIVLANVQAVLAVELLTAAQGIDWRAGAGRSPREPEGASSRAELRVATEGKVEEIAAKLGKGTAAAYRAIRAVAPTVIEDRPLDGDLNAVRRLVAGGELVEAVREAGVGLTELLHAGPRFRG